MSTGPWHYEAAEQFLKAITNGLANESVSLERAQAIGTLAQAHATVALAAATALSAGVDGCEPGFLPRDMQAWESAAGTREPERTEPAY